MHEWMLDAPEYPVTNELQAHFQDVLNAGNAELLHEDVPRWMFLHWLAQEGYLLHGSSTPNLRELRPVQKNYNQPDEFSNTIGIYAASDGLWAMMYALRGPDVARQHDMGLQQLVNGRWSAMRYFLSFASRDPDITNGRDLLAPGVVYVLERGGFIHSPAYEHGGLGFVQEAHWVNPSPVKPIMAVPVKPEDFPLPVRIHDDVQAMARAARHPWGFPWLDEQEKES